MEKEKLFKELDEANGNYYAYFRNMVRNYDLNFILNEYDPVDIKEYFSSRNQMYYEYIFFVALLEKEEYKNKVLSHAISHPPFFERLIEQMENFYSLFYGIDYDILKNFIFKIEELGKKPTSFLSMIEEEKQLLLLKEPFKEETLNDLLPHFKNKVIETFLKESPNAYSILEKGILSVPDDIIFRNILLPSSLLKSNLLFEKIKGSSMIGTRNLVNRLLVVNPDFSIETRLEEYEENLINQYNEVTGLFRSYEGLTLENIHSKIDKSKEPYLLSISMLHDINPYWNEEEFQTYLKKETKRKLSELVMDYLFKDNYYNVKINLKEILRYERKKQIPYLLSSETLALYEIFSMIDHVPNDKKIDLFKTLKDQKVYQTFYENLRKCKNEAYQNMIEGLYHVPSEEDKVYTLKGEKFSMLVRGMEKFSSTLPPIRKRGCYSLIDDGNLDVMPGYSHYYGYQNIDMDFISHIFENDCYSSNDKDHQTNAINRIMTSKQITEIAGYSEIQILNQKKDEKYLSLSPSYLVVFDEVTPYDQEEAKRLHIPIVKIEKSKYPKQVKTPSHMMLTNIKDGYRYIKGVLDEKEIRKQI